MRSVLIAIVFTFGCGVEPPADFGAFSCGRICNSNIECSTDIIKRCQFCSFGSCSSTLPLDPTDAGVVDAAPDPGPTR